MGAPHTPVVTGYAELAYQLEHPTPQVIRSRAIEVFGAEDLAERWMSTPLPILDNHTPREFAESGDAAKMREVLVILGRIDFGMFS